MMTEPQRIAVQAFDDLRDRGVTDDHAAYVAQQVGEELRRDDRVAELFVVKITDSHGAPHACVLSKVPDGAVPLFRFDIAKHRARARRDTIEELRVDLRLNDDGTEI